VGNKQIWKGVFPKKGHFLAESKITFTKSGLQNEFCTPNGRKMNFALQRGSKMNFALQTGRKMNFALQTGRKMNFALQTGRKIYESKMTLFLGRGPMHITLLSS